METTIRSKTDTARQRPSYGKLLRIWLGLGLQSFGGGAATLYLIRRAVVEEQDWLTPEEFTRDWAICQIAPGINLLGITILIGRRTGGALGILLALLGLLLPSVSVTIALTALYAGVQQFAGVQAALRAVIPATVGLGFLLAWQTGRPIVQESRREGRAILWFGLATIPLSALVFALWNVPVIWILIGGGLLGALGGLLWERRPLATDEESAA
jgi:chromate transporter